jgi:hypothetical protein
MIRGMTVCEWDVPDPLCCECWNTADPAMKAQAVRWATDVMFAKTGRQFGPCEITVRPCMERQCDILGLYGAAWSGSLWQPYILDGVWRNCFCGSMCSCRPRCQVRLAGPVQSITEVTISGIVVPDDSYRVDDFQWLVRENGECWPDCANMDNSSGGEGVWEVTYMRGSLVPLSVLDATAILACEYVKRCKSDASCRLSSRVVAMSRQGTDFQFVPPDEMIKLNLTGIAEVDDIIIAFNPAALRFRPQVFSQAIRYPRQQTWP